MRSLLPLQLAAALALTSSACGDPVVAESYLSVVNISPSSGSAGVPVDTDVAVTFSEPLVSSTITADNVQLLDEGGGQVGTDLTYMSEDLSLVLTPDSALLPGTTYELVLTTGLSGQESGPLVVEVGSTFTTTGGSQTSNELPVAQIVQPASSALGETVTLDGAGSYDPEGAELSFAWRMVDAPEASMAEIDDVGSPVTTTQLDAIGVWIIGLVVDDGAAESNEAYLQLDVE